MKNFDAIIVGGGPAGVQAAISTRRVFPDKTVALIRKEKISLIPCGIPYTIGTLESVDADIFPDTPLINNNIEIIIGEVQGRKDKVLILTDGEELGFDKLVLAIGSSAILPDIPGIDQDGIFTIKKDFEYLKKLRETALKAQNVLIIGGGYIGVELADEFLKMGKQVTIVEMMSRLFATSMDPEFGKAVEENLKNRGCRVITNARVNSLSGDGKVSGVKLTDDRFVEADFVIVSVGYKSNTFKADSFGLDYDKKHGFVVDEYMRTSDKDVFAAGDCAITRSCFNGEIATIMLASAAMAQGRLAGANLFGIRLVKSFPGTLGTFSTKIGDLAIGATGITEQQAKAMNLDYIIGVAEAPDRHPGSLPGASKISIKLIFAQHCHYLLGAQVMGGDSVGEMTNMLSVMVQKKMTDIEIDTMQIGTHPLLTSSPIAYPIINASVNAIMQWLNK
ncbi:MAG: FAD-dependent oxidoreductase [Candidatus Electryoneaceae bacterium]|nr:FAD-dependent oxidoreductase [Candidatus Electryoneaceae bacterium]